MFFLLACSGCFIGNLIDLKVTVDFVVVMAAQSEPRNNCSLREQRSAQ
jgi:hypothetical protein